MQDSKQLKEEMIKEELETTRTKERQGRALPQQNHHQGTTWAASSSGESDAHHMDEEQSEGNANRPIHLHASKSSTSMRPVTAGGYGENPIIHISGDQIEMDILSRQHSGNAGQGSGEKQTRRIHPPNTPPKVASPVDDQSSDDVVLRMHPDQGNELSSDYKT